MKPFSLPTIAHLRDDTDPSRNLRMNGDVVKRVLPSPFASAEARKSLILFPFLKEQLV